MARSMDTKDRRGKKRQARAAAAQGKRGVNKAGSEAEAESDEERQQNNLAEEATGGEKRTCLGYNREISSLLPSARGALGTHKSSSFSQEQQRQEPTAGHSEENPQQQATKTRTTLITSNTFSLWAAKRQCPPPYQARAELPEDCCCTPATVSGWSQQQQREAGVAGLVCELPAEVPETPQAFDAAVSGRRRRRSSPLPSLNRRDGVVSVGGLEPKNGGRGGEGWKNDSKTLAQKGLIPHRYGKKENGQDLYDKQGDREHGSPCSSNESGPLGRLDVKEGGNMDAENWI
ncbi:hypothetical protein B0T20DRAFT_254936 [Sordaria brevicollis]|uniref:Uncharacterized protein n=1 Tax=Sordaria brevicollis TaxID=83679 RepID=A0AAE0PCF3_SORBR|nr:hypothetical protein B0T20DRAFT_254936 [Sordaria brevicollis]